MLQDAQAKARLEAIHVDARARVNEQKVEVVRNKEYYQRVAHQPAEPIFIASTEGIGSARVRANHSDAALDYFSEQEQLKNAKSPI